VHASLTSFTYKLAAATNNTTTTLRAPPLLLLTLVSQRCHECSAAGRLASIISATGTGPSFQTIHGRSHPSELTPSSESPLPPFLHCVCPSSSPILRRYLSFLKSHRRAMCNILRSAPGIGFSTHNSAASFLSTPISPSSSRFLPRRYQFSSAPLIRPLPPSHQPPSLSATSPTTYQAEELQEMVEGFGGSQVSTIPTVLVSQQHAQGTRPPSASLTRGTTQRYPRNAPTMSPMLQPPVSSANTRTRTPTTQRSRIL
jgi:hypothetical protein